MLKNLQDKFGREHFLYDSADKLTHKIPLKYDLEHEKAIPIILDHSEEPSTINQESGIINKMTEPINILRIYACENVAAEAEKFVRQRMKDMCDQE